MRKRPETALTRNQAAELQALAELPDDRIDTDDIPEMLDWSDARRGLFYRSEGRQDHIGGLLVTSVTERPATVPRPSRGPSAATGETACG